MSLKRRRGIGMRTWLVAALKDCAKAEGIKSHTAVANKILQGKIGPIRSYEQYKEKFEHTKQGVSMPEELWLALKAYSKGRGKGESDTQVACKIIVGKIPSIPEECIQQGKREAREREADRATLEPDPPKVEDAAVTATAEVDSKEEQKIVEKCSEEKKDENGRALSRGEPVDEEAGSSERKINPDDDFYGGVFNM